MNRTFLNLLASFMLVMTFFSCNQQEKIDTAIDTKAVELGVLPDWAKNANIYEVNVRQYTPEGTFNAFATHLPRLQKMGVDILWFMPIYPIGEVKRKGSEGSYYSIKDFKAVNPRHGTIDDFKNIVKQAHELGMKVILDWVPNHSSWDNDWINQHPDWYTYDNDTITHPLDPNSGDPTGWTDVADFNYDNQEMRAAMIDALTFWVEDADVDGYRCDVAGFVPNDFWNQAITALNKKKHVFMLAEWDNEPAHFENGFHMNYSWEYKEVIKEVSEGHKNAADVWDFYKRQEEKFPEQAIHMYFITNHDENSWNNYPANLGNAQKALAVLTHTWDGMPLIYSGQESNSQKQLSFFDKDEIEWGDFEYADFYKSLLALKHNNPALANGIFGGKMVKIDTETPEIFAFKREKDNNTVEVFINLSDKEQTITLPNKKSLISEGINKDNGTISPWGFVVYN